MSRRWPRGPGRPRGPRLPWPLVGARALRDLPGLYEGATRRYGTRWLLSLPDRDWLFSAEPEDAALLMAADPEVALAGEASASLRPVGGERSVVLLDGAEHMRARRVLLPSFHGERMRSHLADMEQLTHEMVDAWRPGQRIKLHDEARRLSFRIIVRTVLGIRDRERADEAVRRIERLFGGAALVIYVPALQRDLGPMSPWARFLRLRRRADEVVHEAVAARRAAKDAAGDVLSTLLEARHEDGRPLSDGELRDQLMTLLVAGHETTAAAIAWTVDSLLRHPAELDRLRGALAAGDEQHLQATVRESLRHRPPVPMFGRVLAAPLEVGPYTAPAGVAVAINTWSLHRRRDLFPAPDEFRPQRFLDAKPPANAYLPFGGGVRRCLGAPFAEQELRVVIGALLSRTRLRLATSRPEGFRLRGVTLVPARGVPLRVESVSGRA